MLHLTKRLVHLAPHAARGRSRQGERWESVLQVDKFTQQRVELVVAHQRTVVHIVLVIVVVHELRKLGYACLCFFVSHWEYSILILLIYRTHLYPIVRTSNYPNIRTP